mgnify:CR=1 FL=1
MASTLKINTLTGVSTAGSIAVTGEGNSTTTNLQQGLAKSFVRKHRNGTTTLDTFNISSMADTATGIFTVVFTNNHNNDDYMLTSAVMPEDNTTVITTCEINREQDIATSGYRGETAYVNSSNNRTDSDYTAAVVTHGDLA